MSSTYSKNDKTYAGAQLLASKDVWIIRNGKPILRKDIDIIGKVDVSMPNFVVKANNPNRKTGYIDDISAFPDRVKNDLVNHFFDSHGKRTSAKVAYIVRGDSKAKGVAIVKDTKSKGHKG